MIQQKASVRKTHFYSFTLPLLRIPPFPANAYDVLVTIETTSAPFPATFRSIFTFFYFNICTVHLLRVFIQANKCTTHTQTNTIHTHTHTQTQYTHTHTNTIHTHTYIYIKVSKCLRHKILYTLGIFWSG